MNIKSTKFLFLMLPCIFALSSSWAKTNKSTNKTLCFPAFETSPVNGGFQQDGYWVWGSSVIQGEDGKYHMFVSRWSKHLPFHPGWMVASEIVHAVSDTPVGPFEFKDIALEPRGAGFWDGQSCHNPRVVKYKNGYGLFYMGSTHPFKDKQKGESLSLKDAETIVARSNKRVGIAVSKSLNGPWERLDQPILETVPDSYYSFLTSNPSPVVREDGSILLMFKSRAYKSKFPYHGSMNIGIAVADDLLGPYKVITPAPLFGENQIGVVEDPFLWEEEGILHMVAKDHRGEITGERGDGFHAVSKNGLKWELTSPALAYTKQINWSDGKIQKMGQLERPFILFENNKPAYMYFATMDGPGGFENASRSWNMVVPLKKN